MLPGLATFSRDTGFNDSCCLKAREVAWSALQHGKDNLDPSLIEACLKNAPDTADFSHQLTSNALNAVFAISDIMGFAMDGDQDRIVNVSALATDTVYLYLTSQEVEDTKFLAALPERFDGATVSALKARWNSQLPLLPLTLGNH